MEPPASNQHQPASILAERTTAGARVLSVLFAFAAITLTGYWLGITPRPVLVVLVVASFYVLGQWLSRNRTAVVEKAGAFRPLAAVLIEGPDPNDPDIDPPQKSGAVHWRVDWVLGLLRGLIILALQLAIAGAWLRLGLPSLGALHWLSITGAVAIAYVVGKEFSRSRHLFGAAPKNGHLIDQVAAASVETLEEIERRRGVSMEPTAATASESGLLPDVGRGLARGALIATANSVLLAVWQAVYSPIPGAIAAAVIIAVLIAPSMWATVHAFARRKLLEQFIAGDDEADAGVAHDAQPVVEDK